MSESAKSCATCRFMSAERPQSGMIQPVMMCRYGPLIAVMVPLQGIGTAGMVSAQIRALCPAVGPQDWCHRYEALPPTAN